MTPRKPGVTMSGELRPLAIPGGDSQILPVRDEGDVKSSLLFVGKLADLVGFNPVARASVMTAVSELASNILKYAGRGQLRIRAVEGRGKRGIEVVAEDHGPGIPDVQLAMRDHFSESGTLGLGLPGARRLMDEFHLWSEVGKGTRVTIRKWKA
jgi:serine/threonine-protein kinase RsbT